MNPPKIALGVVSAILISAAASQAQVLTLGFADGNGTTSVDQYQGISGSGWNTAWSTARGGSTSSSTLNVINTNPLTTGGGNYLSVNYTVAGGGGTNTQFARVSRQISSSAISLSSPITFSFDLRPDSPVSNANQTFAIFNGQAATNFASSVDTWRITASGAGWAFSDGASGTVTASSLGAPTSGSVYRFTINSDPTTKTYTATILNLTANTSYTSPTMGWRNTSGTTENTFLNFVGQTGATSSNSFGYSLDNISVIPEPSTLALGALGAVSLLFAARKRLKTC